MATHIFLEFSPRTLGKMNPFWRTRIFLSDGLIGSTTIQVKCLGKLEGTNQPTTFLIGLAIDNWMFPKIGFFPQKWMVKIMEHLIKLEDLGGISTTIFGNIQLDDDLFEPLHLRFPWKHGSVEHVFVFEHAKLPWEGPIVHFHDCGGQGWFDSYKQDYFQDPIAANEGLYSDSWTSKSKEIFLVGTVNCY